MCERGLGDVNYIADDKRFEAMMKNEVAKANDGKVGFLEDDDLDFDATWPSFG